MEPLPAANEALLLLTSSHLSLTYKAVRGILIMQVLHPSLEYRSGLFHKRGAHMTTMTEKNFDLTLAAILKDQRKSRGYSQLQISQYLGINRSTYTYYESGHTSPSIYTLFRLALYYGIPVSEFFPESVRKGRRGRAQKPTKLS